MISLAIGCTSLTDRFDDAVASEAARQPTSEPSLITDTDIDALPAPVARWLRRVGVVGTPRMQIRVAGVVDMVDESGDAFTRAETVTMLNEFCIMAPGALLDDRFVWQPVNDTSATVTFTNGAHRVSATLFFDANDDLVDFSSDDRHSLPDDGDRWTTPLRGHREVNGLRLPTEGDAVWHYADKPAWRYGRFVLQRIRYNVPVGELPRADALGALERAAP